MLSAMAEIDPGVKIYLDYLDKEMTIMGILSTFGVAAAALILDRVMSNGDKATEIGKEINSHSLQMFVCSAMFLGAALYFYLQRSMLALYYGEICMSLACPDLSDWDTGKWLKEAGSWATWARYRVGLVFLALAVICAAHVIYQAIFPQLPHLYWVEYLLAAFMATLLIAQNMVLSAYRYEDDPYAQFSLLSFPQAWKNRGQQ
jgi:hypothetical protein